jgi:hypothetical protein
MSARTGKIVTRSVVVALVAAGLLGACGGGGRVDAKGVEKTISTKLERAYAPVRVGPTTCPSPPPLERGATFRCATEVDGRSVDVRVTLRDTEGAITFTTTRAVIVVAQVEADLRARLHDAYDEPGDVMKISVHCAGPRVRVLDVGATFRCAVEAGGTSMAQEVTVADLGGAVTFRAVD